MSSPPLPFNFTGLPANVLDSFLPGYSVVSQVATDVAGFDITILVSVFILLFIITKSLTYIYSAISAAISTHMSSSITVNSSEDNIWTPLMGFITQVVLKNPRHLIATNDQKEQWEDNDQDVQGVGTFGSWNTNLSLKYDLGNGTYLFLRNWNIFVVRSGTKMVTDSDSIRTREIMFLTLSCFGRSPKPIQNLIRLAREYSSGQDVSSIRIYHPNQQRNNWTRSGNCRRRPLNTVHLPYQEKVSLINDINKFLRHGTQILYHHRGIPHRRGYLFYGPPGTGKSSMSQALSGFFGLSIYVINLSDRYLTDDDLARLFASLPKSSMLLLEDIDRVNLTSKKEPIGGGGMTAKITLSGILNAIDGVAAQEGRILVISANNPEVIEPALIRAGRIDVQVSFDLATHDQILQLFIGMYCNDNHNMRDISVDVENVADELKTAAKEFARKIPESRFSIAEIQEFLLQRTDDWNIALKDVTNWKDGILAAKRKGLNVRDAQ